MIDSVGYMVDGAVGAEENGVPRMVTTPWYDQEIPMTQAAELGTKKVMEEHCSIGLVLTTDGSIADIPRASYVPAERRAILDMKATGKPFLVVVNSREPGANWPKAVERYIAKEYGLRPYVADCQSLDKPGIAGLFQAVLARLPHDGAAGVPAPVAGCPGSGTSGKNSAVPESPPASGEITDLGQAEQALSPLAALELVQDYSLRSVDFGSGVVSCTIILPEALFYEILSSRAGIPIQNDAALINLLSELSEIRREYDKISAALASVKATGYGVVMPTAEEMKLEKPEILKRGGSYGVRLKAGAPSIHMMRVDIDTEISPMVGDEKQSQQLIDYLKDENPDNLWQSNIFGKSVYDLIQDGLNAKLTRLPEEVRGKFRGTLTRIVNEGANGLICLII